MSIQELEQSVRRLRLALIAVAVLAALPWLGVALLFTGELPRDLWTQALPRVLDLPCEIKARAFRALDEKGRELAFVGRDGKGGGNLTLRNGDGQQILVAADFDGHGGYVELGTAKRISTHLGAGDHADGFLLLRNEAGKDLGYFGRDKEGHGALYVNRADGTELATIGRDEGGESFLNLLGPNGKPGAVLSVGTTGGVLDLFDAATRKFLYAGPSESGSGFVKVLDEDGSLLAVFGTTGTTPRGGFFEAFNEHEQPLFYGGRSHDCGHGLVNVCSKDGRQLVAIGIDGHEQGGVLNVFDLAGTMVLRTPDWE